MGSDNQGEKGMGGWGGHKYNRGV